MEKTFKKILVIKLRDIGDLVLSTPVLKVLNENYHSPEIVYVVKKEYASLGRLLPFVGEVITYDKNSLMDLIRVIIKLRRGRFDLVVNLHATFRSAFIALLSGAKLRLVHNHSGKDYFTSVPLKIKDGPKSIILRDLETLAPLGLKITDSQMHTQLRIFPAGNDMTQNSPDLPAIGFGVGAKRPAKMWKNEKFIELGKELIIKGYGIVVFCSKKEANDGARIVDVLGDKAKLFDGLDFPELARALKRVSLFVGNDSGLRHMAAALNVKTVTLFGPEDPVEWHPYLEKDGHIAVMHRLDCVNCAENDCPKGSHECMELITVDEVMDAVKRLL